MGLANLWTYTFGRGYCGGPDFEFNEGYRLDLDGIELEATLPRDNIALPDTGRQLNFPFRSPGWFEGRRQQLWNHFYVTVLAHNWAYLGPVWKTGNQPLGVFAVDFCLKTTPAGHAFSIRDLSALERAIHLDYEEYFEDKEPGEYGRGWNTEVRQRAEEMFTKPYETTRDLKAEKAHYLKLSLREIPKHFERRRYGDQSWVYYGLEHEPSYPGGHYCHPLDDQYYLDIVFTYVIGFRNYFHLWQAHAEAAEQQIMSTVRLMFP